MTTRVFSILCASVFLALISFGAKAQQHLSDDDLNRYVAQIRAYKHDYLTKELQLTKTQQEAFFDVYDQMEDAILKMTVEVRTLENKALADDASSEDITAAADALYSQKQREGEIEMEYYEKFKTVLTPEQTVLLKRADRRFNQELMKQHRRIRKDKAEKRR